MQALRPVNVGGAIVRSAGELFIQAATTLIVYFNIPYFYALLYFT